MNLNPTSDIEQLLPIHEPFKVEYEKYVNNGKDVLKGKKIVFSMLCRNSEKSLKKNVDLLVSLVEPYVEDYRFVIFENDSTDNTVDVLQSLYSKNSKIQYRSEKYERPHFGPVKSSERTNALAEYRNKSRDIIREKYSDFDYAIVVDSDFISMSQDGFYNSFGLMDFTQCDAMAGTSYQLVQQNGKTQLWNYDSWAFRGSWWHDLSYFRSQFVIDNPMLWFGFYIIPRGSSPYAVNSAFGGMAIYKMQTYLTGDGYSGQDCEHVMFHLNIRKNTNSLIMVNPSQIMLMPGP